MSEEFVEVVYLCPKCLEAQSAPGPCPNDGTELLSCRPGDPDDPCRRPLMDRDGQVRSRAPKWWLNYSVKDLMDYLDDAVQG
jgi:hypothetical protein